MHISHVFSCCVTYYELLTGYKVFCWEDQKTKSEIKLQGGKYSILWKIKETICIIFVVVVGVKFYQNGEHSN